MTTIHDDEPGSRMRELERSLLRAELERDVLAHRKDEPEAVVAGATYAGGADSLKAAAAGRTKK